MTHTVCYKFSLHTNPEIDLRLTMQLKQFHAHHKGLNRLLIRCTSFLHKFSLSQLVCMSILGTMRLCASWSNYGCTPRVLYVLYCANRFLSESIQSNYYAMLLLFEPFFEPFSYEVLVNYLRLNGVCYSKIFEIISKGDGRVFEREIS